MRKSEQAKRTEGLEHLEAQTPDNCFEAEINGNKFKVYEYNCKGMEERISEVVKQCAIHKAIRECFR